MKPIEDTFRGNDERLCQCIEALIKLNDEDALVPHGVGGHAREMLVAAYHRLNDRINTLTAIRELKPDYTNPEGYVRSIRKIAGMAIERITEEDIAETEPPKHPEG